MLLQVVFVIALIANAMSAALSAGRRSMDWVGVCMLAAVTALGGGSLRDVLLGHYPLYWVAHPWSLGVTTGAALFTVAAARLGIGRLRTMFIVLDAIGLVVVTISGCDVALQMGQAAAIAVIAGMITGCAGGVLRDVLCNQVPLLFSSELYASVSILTGTLYVVGLSFGLPADVVTLAAMTIGLALRLLAVRHKWNMPHFVYTADWD